MKLLEWAFFALSGLLTLGGALMTVGSRKPVRSAMGLLATILGICGCYLMLAAEFLAAIQLIVYAGAVVVLFIFIIMLLGPAATTAPDARSAISRYVGAGVFLLAFGGALTLVVRAGTLKAVPAAVGPSFGSIEVFGKELFTTRVVPFELTGALLLVAVVGALAVARGKQPDPTTAVTAGTARTPGGKEGS